MLENEHEQNVSSSPTASKTVATILAGTVILSLVIHIVVLVTPPTPGMLWDHHWYVRWGAAMLTQGLNEVYTAQPPLTPMLSPTTHKVYIPEIDEESSCNYPPLSMLMIYGQAIILRQLDPDMVSNTVTARVIFCGLSVVFNLLIAWMGYRIVNRYTSPVMAACTFAVVALGPPFIIDAAHWGQTDSWVLLPLVCMLAAMMRERWLLAGLLWGIALSIKPQAALMAPVWLIVLITRPRKEVLIAIFIAPVILAIFGLPFTLGGGESWAERSAWFQRSYVDNLLHSYPDTTLKAFNVWYLDLLICENDDAMVKIAGVTKDAWGKVLFGSSLLAFFILGLRKKSGFPDSLLFLTGAILLLSVIMPTRVHERYILMPLPFLIIAAGINRKMWLAVVPMIIVASFQITVLDWMRMGAHSWRYVVEKVEKQYAEMEQNLPAEELAKYPKPQEQAAIIRPQFLKDRWNTGDPVKEWTLTLAELLSATGCLIMIALALIKPESAFPQLES